MNRGGWTTRNCIALLAMPIVATCAMTYAAVKIGDNTYQTSAAASPA